MGNFQWQPIAVCVNYSHYLTRHSPGLDTWACC